jgi:uncharacterized small protein (DUF1192 family)
MAIDDDLPRPKPARLTPPLLDGMGLAELNEYVTELEAEIVRVKAEITRKSAHRAAMDAFFRKP